MNCLSGAEHLYVTGAPACARLLPARIATPKTAAEHASVITHRRLGLTRRSSFERERFHHHPFGDSQPRFTRRSTPGAAPAPGERRAARRRELLMQRRRWLHILTVRRFRNPD